MLTQISQITQNYNLPLANLANLASLHSRIVLRKHSAKPTAASEAMQLSVRLPLAPSGGERVS